MLYIFSDRGDKDDVNHHIQADANDYVVSSKTLSRANGCIPPPSRITITPNPLADSDNKVRYIFSHFCFCFLCL